MPTATATATATDPATVNRDRRAWLAAAIARERDGFGRAGAVKAMQAELFALERAAAGAGWIRNAERKIPTRRFPSGPHGQGRSFP